MESKNGGEIRRIHVIYFLSRLGRIEHPHLIRVHHLNKNGVFLRDVKRWLADLRGKDMPELFSWSYKRRYKSGYVWQDLMDEDLITPISDNEYVLKGSEISPIIPFEETDSVLKNPTPAVSAAAVAAVEDKHQQPSPEKQIGKTPDVSIDTRTKTSSEINEESSLFGSEESKSVENHEFPSLYSNKLYEKHPKKNPKKYENLEKTSTPRSSFSSTTSSAPESPFIKSKNYTNGATNILRNLLSCGAVDTNDAVLVMINRANKNSLSKSKNRDDSTKAEIRKSDSFGSSCRSFGTPWNQQNQRQNFRKRCDDGNVTKKKSQASAVYKPVSEPNCSQCGKSFKPEKMHKHMKSCKGMRNMTKTGGVYAEKTSFKKSTTFAENESDSGYFLTN